MRRLNTNTSQHSSGSGWGLQVHLFVACLNLLKEAAAQEEGAR